jgi:hypothetical protein
MLKIDEADVEILIEEERAESDVICGLFNDVLSSAECTYSIG